ncbi:thermonuclease family protein [Radiobacillus sp. PE A8.2]|uniref:thermonuclease family protein n=1 Tax=Radiobacillus sp. PE A8.2 TaxID=3380349 RepID=UPI003890B0DF
MKNENKSEVTFMVVVSERNGEVYVDGMRAAAWLAELEKQARKIEAEANVREGKLPPVLDKAKVRRVVDGDTIEVEMRGNVVDVRLLLVDTPETVDFDLPVEKFGPEATRFADQVLTAGKIVELEYDGPREDQYGRVLAYVWVDGRIFNQMLLEEGLANLAYVFDPPYKYYDTFLLAQTRARNDRKGLWGRA